MDVRNNLEGLGSLQGAQTRSTATASPHSGGQGSTGELTGDHVAFSSAGSEASLESLGDGVRMDRVAAVQAALAAGTYNVPSSAVAAKLVDAMLAGAK